METQNLAKWISELQAQIDQVKRIAMAAGGDNVTITPELESGTKIADYAIGSDEGSLYAPEVTITPELESGVKIADFAIGSTEGSLYAPEGGNELDFSAPMKIGKLGSDEVFLAMAVKTTATGAGATFTVPSGVTGIKDLIFASMFGRSGTGSQYFVGQWFSAPYQPNTVDGLYTIEGLRYDPSTNTFNGATRSGTTFDKVIVLFVYTKAAPTQQTKKITKKK